MPLACTTSGDTLAHIQPHGTQWLPTKRALQDIHRAHALLPPDLQRDDLRSRPPGPFHPTHDPVLRQRNANEATIAPANDLRFADAPHDRNTALGNARSAYYNGHSTSHGTCTRTSPS